MRGGSERLPDYAAGHGHAAVSAVVVVVVVVRSICVWRVCRGVGLVCGTVMKRTGGSAFE